MAYANLAQMFFQRAEELAARPRYRYRAADGWREVTWQAMAERVRAAAAGLIAMGVQPGDRVALLSNTRAEWMEIDFAILACGALTVPIYQSSLPAECGYIIANSGSLVVFVENPKQRAKIEEVMEQGFELDGVRQKVEVETVITIDGDPGEGESLATLLERGRDAMGRTLAEIRRRVVAAHARGSRDHRLHVGHDRAAQGRAADARQPSRRGRDRRCKIDIARGGDVDFFFLPLAHSFARMVEYFGLAAGTVTAFARSIDTLAEDIAASRRTSSPRCRASTRRSTLASRGRARAAAPCSARLFDWAIGVGRKTQRARAGATVGGHAPRSAGRSSRDRLVFSRIHKLLGGNVRYMMLGRGAARARDRRVLPRRRAASSSRATVSPRRRRC